MYRVVTSVGEIREYLSGKKIAAFDFETAPDEPYRSEDRAALDPADAETVRYACADSDYTLRLYHLFNEWFDRYLPRHRWIVENVESPTAVYVGLMRYNCILVDRALMERTVGKLNSTYIDGYVQHLSYATGRIHADFMPLATETCRFACRKPNLQNCPRAGADEVGIRNFVIAPEGKALVSCDFSQIELRIGAFYSRDEKMLDTYRTGGDIHNSTADVVFGTKKHDKEGRTIAKNVNFGTFYGLFPRGLQRTLKFKAGLDTPLNECERIITNLKSGYPKLGEWQLATVKRAKSDRYIEAWLGRRRYLPNINSQDWNKRSFAERCALNTPIQSTAADILKLALGRLIAGLPVRPWLRPLLQIHDELVFEVPETKVSEAVAFIKECMEARPFPDCDVPITAEVSVGKSYGNMTKIPNLQTKKNY